MFEIGPKRTSPGFQSKPSLLVGTSGGDPSSPLPTPSHQPQVRALQGCAKPRRALGAAETLPPQMLVTQLGGTVPCPLAPVTLIALPIKYLEVLSSMLMGQQHSLQTGLPRYSDAM